MAGLTNWGIESKQRLIIRVVVVQNSMSLDVVPRSRANLPTHPSLRWGVALMLFGIGDLVTTAVGMHSPSVVEMGVAAPLVQQYGFEVVLALKTVTLVGFYALARSVARPYRKGIPIGLAILGLLVTAWNLSVLIIAGVI